MQHNPRVTDTDRPGDPHGNDAGAQIRTFLIADVRGYTLFTQERGDEAAAKLAAKFADIAREIVEARGGMLLELRGDEALCVFASTREAIRAAVDLQQRFVEETLGQPELPPTVGIGLDAGEAVPVQGGYPGRRTEPRGPALRSSSRRGDPRHPRGHASRVQDRGRPMRRSRLLTFKGIAEPVVVVRVVPEGEDPAIRLRPYASGHTPPAIRARAAGAGHETLPALGCDRRDRRGAGGEAGTFAGTLRHPNVFLSGWIADYLGARNFIEPQFACGEAGFANGHGWCDETLNERMDEASALQVTDPGAANRAWGEMEHQLVDAAVQAPITNPLRTHAVSDRVENVQVHLQWGLMLSLIWVQ